MAAFLFPCIIKINIMSDNKTTRGTQDRIRVDLNDPSEVEYLHQQFPDKTHEQIKEAIKAKGPMREDIVEYLKSQN